jgi:site-specific recombinase XerD
MLSKSGAIEEFTDYLNYKLAPSTAKRYTREIDKYFEAVESPQTATYSDIMDYIGQLRKQYQNGATINCSLAAIKQYYSYLIYSGQRTDHPAKAIRLRDNKHKDIQLQDLFTEKELELLMERKERYEILKNRNRIIVSLLIYQGLTSGEIKQLELNDVDLEKGSIYIKSSRKTNPRTLPLKPNQILLLYKYIQEDRPKLVKTDTSELIISKLGTAETGEGIGYLIETKRHLFPERKLNAKTIRQSVITNLLKQGKDLRIVQVFAGHRYPSSTEQYKQTDTELLKTEVQKYHPLG